jgi:hypothetical protein
MLGPSPFENSTDIQKGDFVRLLNKRGVFEKEGQRFTCKIYLVDAVGCEFREKKTSLTLLRFSKFLR